MARNPRYDERGSWHYVMNRGIARRTVFERRADVRYFLSRIARAVRRGELEIHAYCILTTHFHLLVRSHSGKLAEGMRRIQNEYVRWFNRSRRRDGPLFRGRFKSKPVKSLAYRRILVRYIDANPVAAGLVQVPSQYPHGSARAYSGVAGRPWLERSWIESAARAAAGTEPCHSRGYSLAFGGSLSPGLSGLVEARLSGKYSAPDPLDELVEAAPGEVLTWMQRKAELADRTRPGLPVCDIASVTVAVERARLRSGRWLITPGKKQLDAWPQVHAALLRDLTGLSSPNISRRLGCSESSVSRMRARHRESMLEEEYAGRVQLITVDALRACGLRRGGIGRKLP